MAPTAETHSPKPTGNPLEVFQAFLKLGLTSFGGPVAHLGYFRTEFVQRRKWISDDHYGQLVALCQFLPGPASSQVGFALGLLRGGTLGALAAWAAFTLPSALLLVLFALGAVHLGGPVGDGLLMGLKAVAVAVVAHAVVGMASTLAPDFRRGLIVAAGAALALLIPGNLGQVTAIGVGLVAGLLFCRGMAGGADHPLRVPVSKTAGLVSAGLFAVLLMGLPLLAGLVANPWVATADAFYRSGALVFGGGHVVLPLLQGEPAIAEAVSQDQFLAGYGAAQAVPGPLFTFAAFLGFTMGTGAEAWLSSALALVAVFLPGVLLVIAALPFWAAVQTSPLARSGVAGANAAVVGILAAALITPVVTSAITGLAPLLIVLACLALLMLAKWPAWAVVLIGAATGLAASLIGA
ncbi:chromate efflux transporter [Brevibacterium sp. HMSC24B04]|uniref:chromate efflux transporter n=1 Tax=Brevibacterium sp. HMSC24B04 TaxID=1581060 RepID=UPI0008A1C56B|nr:chromate efflux transporter [Brevibacterium sp. HMSC24B04]OFT92409.1 chromate transporter [Brevibacterium sp. HMSC24B04]